MLSLYPIFITSKFILQCAFISDKEKIKAIAGHIRQKGFDLKAILSPTVTNGQQRLRFCLHSYKTKSEISEVLNLLLRLI
jgi:8-amino-7-oxononanoate synthase